MTDSTGFRGLRRLLFGVSLTTIAAFLVYAAAPGTSTLPYAESPDRHFHPKGKPPSEHTLKVIRAARERMPFSDRRDFEEAEKGFIAPLKSMVIQADAGHTAWDIQRYEWLGKGRDFDSIHPSLQRQSELNQKTGLFKVTDGIYQVRGLDLANITFVRGKQGWIVFDPLTALETARVGHGPGDHLRR